MCHSSDEDQVVVVRGPGDGAAAREPRRPSSRLRIAGRRVPTCLENGGMGGPGRGGTSSTGGVRRADPLEPVTLPALAVGVRELAGAAPDSAYRRVLV